MVCHAESVLRYQRGNRLVVMFAVVLVSSSTAAAQCVLDRQTPDISNPTEWRMQASTTQNNCGAQREVEVRAWVQGKPTICQTGTQLSGTCTAKKVNGNAVVTIAAKANGACGFATGISNHQAWNPYQLIEENRLTALFIACPPDPAEECAARGADYYWNGSECVYAPGSPIIISLRRDRAYKLTSVEDGVLFDIDGDGTAEQMGWTALGSEVAFLALDRNNDGQITSGKELFGNHTRSDARNGFEALSLMAAESNGGKFRGSVSSDDPLYARLLLWTDRNHNAVSEPWELRPVSEVLSDIGVSMERTAIQDAFGNLFAIRGWAQSRTASGRNLPKSGDEDQARTFEIWDVYFKVR